MTLLQITEYLFMKNVISKILRGFKTTIVDSMSRGNSGWLGHYCPQSFLFKTIQNYLCVNYPKHTTI